MKFELKYQKIFAGALTFLGLIASGYILGRLDFSDIFHLVLLGAALIASAYALLEFEKLTKQLAKGENKP